MVIPTDPEPAPRLRANPSRQSLPHDPAFALSRSIRDSAISFFDVLKERRSATGATLSAEDISSLLWHSTLLRSRRPGRFGTSWESRSAPSAGGLHPIHLIVLPINQDAPAGLYDGHRHALVQMVLGAALETNRASIQEILGQQEGTTLQFAADVGLVDGCYDHAGSLLWRDAGALAATICFVATALGLAATILGRTGEAVVRAAGMPEGFMGVGGVHVGSTPSQLG